MIENILLLTIIIQCASSFFLNALFCFEVLITEIPTVIYSSDGIPVKPSRLWNKP